MSAAEIPLASESFQVETPALAATIRVQAPRLLDGRTPARPSLVFPSEPRLTPGASHEPATVFTLQAERVRARITFEPGTSFYGTGEVPGPLERSGRRTTLWNTDSFEFKESSSQLYQSHPWVLALLPDGSARGLLADTIRRGTISIDKQAVTFEFEQEPFDLYSLAGDGPAAVLRALATLIGPAPLPPLWALGYHQCRWSYMSAAELRALASEFRRRKIPCDALWLDIDYMDRFRVFTVDAEAFPDLAGLTAELREEGFRSVAILDPGVAVDSELGREGKQRQVFVETPDGKQALGRVWPGECMFPDFTAQRVRAWWSEHVRAFVERHGVDGLWNDMNEPELMDAPSRTLPEDCRHEGTDGSGGDHARWHNLYGQCMLGASREGFELARPERRPFLLTRANHIAGSRLAAAWTGDNQATWDHLRWSLTMILNLGLSGQPFAGADVGGFSGDPDAELFTRWFELAALLPFFRGHAEKSSCRKEPWAFGAETEGHVRAAIERRMRLLPTLYTLFREASEGGPPPARPLFWADPADADLRTVDDAFLLGADLLVAPVVRRGARTRRVLFPANPGGWYPFPGPAAALLEREHVASAALGCLPLFARAGAVLFENEVRASTATPATELVVHVFCDLEGRAAGRLYEDQGEGHAHASGVFRDARYTVTSSAGEVEIEESVRGSFESPLAERCFVVHRGGATTIAQRTRAECYRIACA